MTHIKAGGGVAGALTKALATLGFVAALVTGAPAQEAAKPTIVLVHGAFAGSDSWEGVIKILGENGYGAVSVANPLRGVASDSAAAAAVAQSIKGPIVMVGHSYGGFLISNAARGNANVKALVFVGAFTPDKGETVLALAGKFPGSTLGETLAAPVEVEGGKDLYIAQDKYHRQFAGDLPADRGRILAATQRPIRDTALGEPSGEPAWKKVPSWHIYGTADKNIPAAAMAFMAKRADARKIVTIEGASHVPHVSHAEAVAKLIIEAASTAK